MTASQKPKTPSMSMNVREGISQAEIDLFCKRASRVALSHLVEDVVVHEISKVEGDARRTVFSIDINFFPEEEYTSEYDLGPLDLLGVFAIRFPLTLRKEIATEMKKLDADLKSQIAELGKGKRSSTREGEDGDAEEEGEEGPRKKRGDDEESEVGDGDAEDEKRARQKKQQATYESDEDESEDRDEEGEGEFDDVEIEAAYAEGEDMDVDSDKKKKRRKKKTSSLDDEISRVSDSFISRLHHATSFNFNPSQCTFELEVCNSM
jgi:DNA-directed RNA polymerase I subunit RPA1